MENTTLKCPICLGKIGKEETEGDSNNGTKYYYLVCLNKECSFRTPTPWSGAAIDHAEQKVSKGKK